MYKNLNAEIARHDITQGRLAEILNISCAAVSHKMSGRTEFTLREARVLSKLFDCSIDYLFEE